MCGRVLLQLGEEGACVIVTRFVVVTCANVCVSSTCFCTVLVLGWKYAHEARIIPHTHTHTHRSFFMCYLDWNEWFTGPEFPRGNVGDDFSLHTHGVNNGQAIKTPGVWYRQSHNPLDADTVSCRLCYSNSSRITHWMLLIVWPALFSPAPRMTLPLHDDCSEEM